MQEIEQQCERCAELERRVKALEDALQDIVEEYEDPSGCVINGALMGRIAKEALEDTCQKK